MVSCPLLPLSVGTDTPGRRRRPLSTLTSSVNLASSSEPLYRRKVCRLLTVKKKALIASGAPKFRDSSKKDSSEVFFCQIKRETSSPPEWLPSFFTFPLSRGYAFPPFRRPAAAGERGPPGTGDVCHDMACALPPPGGGGKREIRHRMVSYPPLNSPSSSLGRDSLRSRV